jgi:Leucine-rich repeat (LRR) protein
MQVDNTTISHAARPPYSISADDAVDPSSFCLLPLHGYSHKRDLTITAPALPLIALHSSLPAELIEKIQSFCSPHDLLSLTSVDKAAFATRLYNLSLPHLSLKTIADTEQFLAYCRASQEREAQDLSAEDTQKSRKRLKFEEAKAALLMTPFTKEHLQWVTTLTLRVADHFTAEQYALLFSYLSGVTHLTVHSPASASPLSPLFKAAQHLTLHHLAVISMVSFPSPLGPVIYDPFKYHLKNIKDNLPDELWQLTTLETLILEDFECIRGLSTEIDQLSNLTSLTLKDMPSLYNLPDNIGQLNALRSLTLQNLEIETYSLPDTLSHLSKLETLIIKDVELESIPHMIGDLHALKSLTIDLQETRSNPPADIFYLTQLETLILGGMRNYRGPPDELGQLKALKHLELSGFEFLDKLPSTLGQLESLETLILEGLGLEALPHEIGQCRALKSLHLIKLYNFTGLPTTITQLENLEMLILKRNRRFTGSFDKIGQLKALRHLELEGKHWDEGFGDEELPLPSLENLGQLKNLETLILKDLRNFAALTDEINQCTALKSLKLIKLKNFGGLPTTLAQLDKLETVTIEGRGFEIPEVLIHLPALKSLKLINGFLLDEVPDKLQGITKVVEVLPTLD